MKNEASVTHMVRVLAIRLSSVLLCLMTVAVPSQSATSTTYTEVVYPSGDLRIQAYLYTPAGDRPFPVVIYNHGSRAGRERMSVPYQYIGEMLTRAGYVVLVPERRGYGKSDGPVWRSEPNSQVQLVPRLEEETADVLAALDYLRTLPFADTTRIGIMGWSFGGIVTMFAVSRSTAFAVAIDQAGGALTWDANAQLRSALIAAAEHTTTPTLLLVAQNDRTTASITTLADVFKKRGVPHQVVIYEPYTPLQGGRPRAPGHHVFSNEGAGVWGQDVLAFLGRYLAATAK
jgi:dienelactone hydrolase